MIPQFRRKALDGDVSNASISVSTVTVVASGRSSFEKLKNQFRGGCYLTRHAAYCSAQTARDDRTPPLPLKSEGGLEEPICESRGDGRKSRVGENANGNNPQNNHHLSSKFSAHHMI